MYNICESRRTLPAPGLPPVKGLPHVTGLPLIMMIISSSSSSSLLSGLSLSLLRVARWSGDILLRYTLLVFDLFCNLRRQVRRAEEAVGLVQEEQAAADNRAREAATLVRRLQVITDSDNSDISRWL